MERNNLSRKLAAGISILIILSICLCITTFALVFSILSVEGNIFSTGVVKINLNDGAPVIEENDFTFEPGATVVKEFFVENDSTCDVYYKIYFDNVDGELADVLEIAIYDGNEVLWVGKATTLTRSSVMAADKVLTMGEKRVLKVSFHYPEAAGNSTQNQVLRFDFCASAVQAANNPNKVFE